MRSRMILMLWRMEGGIMLSTGAPDLPKELVGMEYWTSLLVQV